MNYHPKPSTLKVPGASIYYEAQGSGPLLLIIPGRAAGCRRLCRYLAPDGGPLHGRRL